jgi:hypothetical protein
MFWPVSYDRLETAFKMIVVDKGFKKGGDFQLACVLKVS